jgi:hypothetical protein
MKPKEIVASVTLRESDLVKAVKVLQKNAEEAYDAYCWAAYRLADLRLLEQKEEAPPPKPKQGKRGSKRS